MFRLEPTAIANSYPENPDSGAKTYPLDLMQCRFCGHVQQRMVFDGVFEGYRYRTPTAEQWKSLAEELKARFPLGTMLEIGCNNGSLLDLLGERAIGIDPSSDHPRAMNAYFGPKVAQFMGTFDVVLAMNVLAHIDDLDGIFDGINTVLKIDGELIFEVQYLPDMLSGPSGFSMAYHEHCDYHHLKPLRKFLRKHGLVMSRWEHLPVHGGSIRIHARKFGGMCDIPEEFLDWDGFRDRMDRLKIALHEEIDRHGKVQAYGAPAKAATFIKQLGLQEKISRAIDDTPQKQGRYIPGTDIPIVPGEHLEDGPVLLLSWNYADIIGKKITNPIINPCLVS